jgi:hypothetical protein
VGDENERPFKKELKKFSIRANRKEIKIMGLVSEEIEANSNTLKINPYVALKFFKGNYSASWFPRAGVGTRILVAAVMGRWRVPTGFPRRRVGTRGK